MDGQRQKMNGGRRRRRRAKSETKFQSAPVLIVARRPDSPRIAKVPNRNIAASAQPKKQRPQKAPSEEGDSRANAAAEERPRRVARMAQARNVALNEDEQRRELLLERLVTCEGRSAISRVAGELFESGGVPEQQQYQLQLLEHIDERRALEAIFVLTRLFQKEPPIKRPILDQRLRRLEDEADEPEVRQQAEALRKLIRSSHPVQPARAS